MNFILLNVLNSNLNVYKSEMNDLHHLGTFYANATEKTYTINSISGYKTLVFIGMDDSGTLQLDTIFVAVRSFKTEGIRPVLSCMALSNYRALAIIEYISDTKIKAYTRELVGWNECGFRVYGMI